MSTGVTTEPFRLLLLRDATRTIGQQATSGIAATLVNSLILTLFWWSTASHLVVSIWAASVWCLSLSRLWSLHRNPAHSAHNERELQAWLRRFVWGMAIAGVLWGAAAFIFFRPDSFVHQITLFMILAGMIAGAATAFSALPISSLVFVVPLSLMWITRSLWEMTAEGLWLAILIAVFTAFMTSLIFRTRRVVRRLVHSRWRNRELLRSVRAHVELGAELTGEVARATERTRDVEAELYEKDTVLQTIVNQAPVSVILTDLKFTILYVYGQKSPVLENQFGQLPGRRIDQVFAAYRPVTRAYSMAVAGHQATALIEFGRYEFELVAAPFRNASDVLAGVLVVAMDVSEELRLRNLQEEFVSHVNHQLRTPLTSVLGSLELLVAERDLTQHPSSRRLIDVALRNALRMKELVQQIARLEETRQAHPSSWVSAQEVAIAAQRIFTTLPGHMAHSLAIDDAACSDKIRIASDTLDTILTCLLKNALEHSEREAEIGLHISVQNETGPALVVRISNRCPPIDAALRGRLFDKFQVGDFSDARRRYGMGLGLYLAKNMIESGDGRIWLERSDHESTEFCFAIPLVPSDLLAGGDASMDAP